VATGMVLLWRYKLTPGSRGEAASTWPAETAIERTPGRPTLVMIAHPKCTCTRASLTELAALLGEGGAAARTHVVFLRPDGVSDDWEKSDTFERARHMPGVEVHVDPGGREAKLFGSTVSGETFLYDEGGQLLFHGGITESRGHEGDNRGRRRVRELIGKRAVDRHDSPAFGCELEGTKQGGGG
jgi:hypothetical protein